MKTLKSFVIFFENDFCEYKKKSILLIEIMKRGVNNEGF